MLVHTPGPWKAMRCDENDRESFAWKVVTDSIDRHQQVVQVVYYERNARLCAAGPDLLRECEAALDALTAMPDGRGGISMFNLDDRGNRTKAAEAIRRSLVKGLLSAIVKAKSD